MQMKKLIDMRENGATYQEIADAVGISKQRVHQIMLKNFPEMKGMRRNHFDIERIIYKGIYDYFKSHPYESLASFIRKIYGHYGNEAKKIKGFITGASNKTFYTVSQIQRMCEITGSSFEELFALREDKSNDR